MIEWIVKYWKPLLGGVVVLAVICGEVQYGRARYQAGYDAATAAITAKMIEQHQQHQKTAIYLKSDKPCPDCKTRFQTA